MYTGRSVDLADVLDVKPCIDPSLPEGHAFWLALHSQPQGLFFISGAALHGDPCRFAASLLHAGALLMHAGVLRRTADWVLLQIPARTRRGGWMGC